MERILNADRVVPRRFRQRTAGQGLHTQRLAALHVERADLAIEADHQAPCLDVRDLEVFDRVLGHDSGVEPDANGDREMGAYQRRIARIRTLQDLGHDPDGVDLDWQLQIERRTGDGKNHTWS